jgi:hypothetical protein
MTKSPRARLPRKITSETITEVFVRPDVVRAIEENNETHLSPTSALALSDIADALGASSVKLMYWETVAIALRERGVPIGREMRDLLEQHADELRPKYRAMLLKRDLTH